MLSLCPGNEHSPLNILCLGAHSDDIEIGCGGTLLRLLADRPGSSVCWVVFAAEGEREREAVESANEFLSDAAHREIIVHRFRESYFPFQGAEIKDAFEALKKRPGPDLIFSHHRHDEHQDHHTLAGLVWNTFRNHLILEYEIPKYEGDLGKPNAFVPLPANVAARKVELIVRHFRSQASRTWFRPETFNGLMAVRGVECNAPEGFAEAFHVRKFVV